MTEVVTPGRVEQIEKAMLAEEAVECPVHHHFGPATPHGPGVYIRECTIPKGTLVLGHEHRFAGLNIMLKGKLRIMVDGESKTIEAPRMFVAPAGTRKLAYAIEETVWLNVYSTDETDPKKLEEMFVKPSRVWLDYAAAEKLVAP